MITVAASTVATLRRFPGSSFRANEGGYLVQRRLVVGPGVRRNIHFASYPNTEWYTEALFRFRHHLRQEDKHVAGAS
jgi:hypothetical protein